MNEAGTSAQKECDLYLADEGHPTDNVIVTSGGRLNSHHILHAVGRFYFWTQKSHTY